jgi:hypothetical protein
MALLDKSASAVVLIAALNKQFGFYRVAVSPQP